MNLLGGGDAVEEWIALRSLLHNQAGKADERALICRLSSALWWS
jgi:hypothetical protein